MPPNPYDNCPCGSGKKFKWCCQAYWDKIEQGLDLHQQGQHDGAIRVMETLVKDHPNQPQAWGYLAHVLFREEQMEKAEQALQKAFDLQPNFAMGHLLRGLFRQSEGEVIGALLLFRKAAEAYPPEAHDHLAQVYEMIARNETILNRLVATRAALARACQFSPGDQELRQQFQAMFSEEGRMPNCVRKEYRFRPTARPVAASDSGRFSDALAAFDTLAKQVPNDPAAWFNLGLVKAWIGDQGPALEALTTSLELEYDDAKAEETAALAEVLKCGHGLAEDSDYTEHRAYLEIREPNTVMQLLRTLEQERRFLAPQVDEENGVFTVMMAEPLPSLVDTGTLLCRVKANVTVGGGMIRIRHIQRDSVTALATELRDRLQLAVGEPAYSVGPAQFAELIQDAFAYPMMINDLAEATRKMGDFAANYFETTWANSPLKALGSATPLDAAGSKLLRKRLLGLIRFQQDCFEASAPRMNREGEAAVVLYDFDRLRHKLGAEKEEPGAPPPELLASAKLDFSAMNVAELSGLNPETLKASELEEAMKAALKLDARELAVHFAKAGVVKPLDESRLDRYTMFLALISAAMSEGRATDAQQLAREGAAYDAAHNGGKRANDYGLRLAQMSAKSQDIESAVKAFDDLINRNPDDGRYFVAAIETMLSAKQGAKALAFADRGLERAAAVGNRDLEGACKELREAALRLK